MVVCPFFLAGFTLLYGNRIRGNTLVEYEFAPYTSLELRLMAILPVRVISLMP